MNKEEFLEIMNNEDQILVHEKDWAFEGLLIIRKYITEGIILRGASHDEIFSVDVDSLLEAGITTEDAIALRNFNWMTEDDEYLACFV